MGQVIVQSRAVESAALANGLAPLTPFDGCTASLLLEDRRIAELQNVSPASHGLRYRHYIVRGKQCEHCLVDTGY